MPFLDVQSRADLVLLASLLQGIRTQALDLVAAIDDLVERSEREPPAGWVPGERGALEKREESDDRRP